MNGWFRLYTAAVVTLKVYMQYALWSTFSCTLRLVEGAAIWPTLGQARQSLIKVFVIGVFDMGAQRREKRQPNQ